MTKDNEDGVTESLETVLALGVVVDDNGNMIKASDEFVRRVVNEAGLSDGVIREKE